MIRLLTAGRERFLNEDRAVPRTGLDAAAWIGVDDTGARHAGRNTVRTRIGNHVFTWLATMGSKGRLNFLDLLRADARNHVEPLSK